MTGTAIMQRRETAMPVMTPNWDARRVRTPSKKLPSIGPYTIEAIVNPAVKTEPQPLATTAIPTNASPQIAVNQRDSLSKSASLLWVPQIGR